MDANPRKLYEFLHGGNQFVIPVFQRKYVWKRENWERLWEDLQTLMERGETLHFMGSIVSAPYHAEPGEPPQFLVIDGQQRMITLVALLSAIRDEAKAAGEHLLARQIQTEYLIHQYSEGDLRYKVFPRLRDRAAFFALVDEAPDGADGSGITQAYRYFRDQVASRSVEDRSATLRSLFSTTTQQLAFVSITLDSEQNPWTIFETLNARGVDLKQSDLIRNQVFMRVPLKQQDAFDEQHWKAFEDQFEADGHYPAIDVADFCRHFLMRQGAYVRPEATYLAFQEDKAVKTLSPDDLTAMLAEYARYYCWLERPKTAPAELQIELDLLKRLDITTTYPLMLHLLKLYADQVISAADLNRCTRALESWYIRRAIVGWSAGAYNRTLPAAIPDLAQDDVVGSLARYLAKRGWPNDEEFAKALPENPIYRYWRKITRVVLLALEAPHEHRETVDVGAQLDAGTITIEHVLPQTIKDDEHGGPWIAALGDGWQDKHAKWLHTLGNLTLTGYNGPLSNHGYEDKCTTYADSHLGLNEWFAGAPCWDVEAIRRRGEALTTKVAEFWGPPGSFDETAGGTQAEDLDDAPALGGPELRALYDDFWKGYVEFQAQNPRGLEIGDAASHWYKRISTPLAWTALYVVARANQRELAVQAYANSIGSVSAFNLLHHHRSKIESEVGPNILWSVRPGTRVRTLDVVRRFELTDRPSWTAAYGWLNTTVHALEAALSPLLGRNAQPQESRTWSEADFFAALSESCPTATAGARRLIEWAQDAGCEIQWDRRGRSAYVNVRVSSAGGPKTLLRLYADNAVAFTMNYLADTASFASDEARTEFRDRLNLADLLEIDPITGEPWIPLSLLSEPDTRAGVLEALTWAVGRVRDELIDD